MAFTCKVLAFRAVAAITLFHISGITMSLAMMAAPPAAPQPSNSPYVLPLRREAVPVRRKGVVVSHKISYSGVVSVGRPAQEFRVVFDTGSGHVVLPSSECENQTCLMHRRYDMKASQSAQAINVDGSPVPDNEECDEVTIGYGTGEVTGQFVTDEICLGPSDATNANSTSGAAQPCDRLQLVMAVAMSRQPFLKFGFDGILGLGLSSLALSKEFSLFDHLSGSGKLPSSHFSIFLSDGEDGDEPEIAFGGYNPKRLLGSLSWEPVVNPKLGYWQMMLIAVRVDGRTLDVCKDGTCRGIMDTGTSHLGIPTPHNDLLGSLLTQDAEDASDCRKVQAPVLEFEFNSFNMTLYPEDYMRHLPLMEGLQVGSAKGVSLDTPDPKHQATPAAPQRSTQSATHGTSASANSYVPKEMNKEGKMQCRPRLMPVNLPAPLGPKLFILGEPVLQRYYTVFDWAGPQIGFGLAKKSRFNDLEQMANDGYTLRNDVKMLLSDATSSSVAAGSVSADSHKAELQDTVIFLQVTVSVKRRRK